MEEEIVNMYINLDGREIIKTKEEVGEMALNILINANAQESKKRLTGLDIHAAYLHARHPDIEPDWDKLSEEKQQLYTVMGAYLTALLREREAVESNLETVEGDTP